ncbi:MAG: TetR family transcriptional regulator, partial [Planctomycetaceae bacterium]|nr:TetR family transcriptional regulator [Planctomycetaceae bacterium]
MTAQTTKRSTKKDSNGSVEDRTAEICRTAAKIICEKGFDAASMNDIASAVNLTKAGLYYYTTGKQDLLFRIIDFAMSLVEERVVQVCAGIDDPRVRLERMIRNHVLLVADGGGQISILSDEVNCLPQPQRKAIIQRKRHYLGFVRETLRELEASGELQDLNPDIAALNIFATISGVARWYRQGGKLSSEGVAD